MTSAFLIVIAVLFAVLAIRSRRLLTSALWLAGVSALLSIVFYLYGARQVAVIELSVGAGLVTVLLVFAVSIAGEDAIRSQPIVPKAFAWILAILLVLLLSWFTLLSPANPIQAGTELALVDVLWQARGLDVLVQVVLIFSGVLGLLGLLAEVRPHLEGPMAEEVKDVRDREQRALEEQVLGKQEEKK